MFTVEDTSEVPHLNDCSDDINVVEVIIITNDMVKKHLKGGELKYDAKARNLLPVFDMQKKEYRMINISTLTKLKINGQVYKF